MGGFVLVMRCPWWMGECMIRIIPTVFLFDSGTAENARSSELVELSRAE